MGVLKGRGQLGLTVFAVLFLGWFTAIFYVDNANYSEMESYSARLYGNVRSFTATPDAGGHYTMLPQYVFAPFGRIIELLGSGAFLVRAYAVTRFVCGVALFAAAYWFYRSIGLRWFGTMLALVLLSICAAFATSTRGWELDKVLEPALYLAAGVALVKEQRAAIIGIAVLAALNRETGLLVPLMLLAAGGRSVRENVFSWQFALALLLSSLIVMWLGLAGRVSLDTGAILLGNLQLERLVYAVGGLCLMPVLAVGMLGSAPAVLRRLFWLMAPLSVMVALSTDKLENGALLLAPTALLFLPIAMLGAQSALAQQRWARAVS